MPAPKQPVAGEGDYPFECFSYDGQPDVYLCPQGRQLNRHADTTKASGLYHVYYNTAACSDCPVRSLCTRGAYRKAAVHEHYQSLAALRTRLQERPDILTQRSALVEHPFGTFKFWLGCRSFLCRGLEMVREEFSLSCLAYNIRRVLNLVGVPKLLRTLAILAALALYRFFSCEVTARSFHQAAS